MPFYVKSPFEGKYYRLLNNRDRFKFPRELIFRASTNIQARDLVAGAYKFNGNLIAAEDAEILWEEEF